MSSGPDVGEGSFLSGLKKVNMKKIVVDDDQEVPKHAAGGAEERALLAELDTALEGVDGASGRGKGEALRLMCLRGCAIPGLSRGMVCSELPWAQAQV